jgi:hypothetical protein
MLGLLVLASMKNDWELYYSWLERAFACNPEHPLTLYYLSEHYLLRLDYERSEKCIRRALVALNQVMRFQFKEKSREEAYRNDYTELKSRLTYMMGFIR